MAERDESALSTRQTEHYAIRIQGGKSSLEHSYLTPLFRGSKNVRLPRNEICDGKLYKSNFDTFEAYCKERWGWSKSHVNRQIEAASTVELMTPIGVKPTTESQARELSPLAREDPDAAREVWRETVEEASS